MYGCFSVAPRPGEEREGTSYFFVIDKKIILSLFRETMSSKNEQKLEMSKVVPVPGPNFFF